ncbi:integral membrane sensor signal transduction histidine kinase [Parvibaculum lavamentivorans DS-1]|uniref:histidine kinase n=1 Tax=Parvibaculum lavamentivorans (strain DS-1 / DSM 13023 / NCIMB 13966) TaxID=402881 RepID=A7HUG7_PARL1|nr:MHYT domain-containing protein [Parvibaculum lavamentivorans]ABS63550.1 integral membrane sensor signal transduction histidine kinase [Parvibaculum lavamentivorans DS-1]
MLTVYNCITVEHDLRLVVLAALLCLFASFSSISLFARAREAGLRQRSLWVLASGFVAGCGIWATHFIAMLAFQPETPTSYQPGLTFASLMIAIMFATIGFAIADRYRPSGTGGAVVGLSIGAMHYVGMAATSMHGQMIWDRDYVAASIVLGVVLGAAATQAAGSLSGLRGRIIGAGLLTLAIASLHFTGMAAVTVSYDAAAQVASNAVEPYTVAIAVAAVTLLIVILAFVGSAVERHLADRSVQETIRLRAHVLELDETRKQLEKTSAELLVALQSASSADQAKSQFLATMSHELRTPLNAILGFSEIMAAETFGPLNNARYSDYVQDIFKSGKHLLSLINDVLDFTRVDAGELHLHEEDIDLEEAVTDTIRMISAQAKAQNIALDYEIAADLPHLIADHRRIRQVLLNLLSNAVKFTPDGGEVHIGALVADGAMLLRVTDTGIGIAAENIPLALERFGQIDSDLSRKYEGTGLGLPLAKCLMEHHGGCLDIASELGRGTTVTVTFPPERVVAAAQHPLPMRA